MAKKTDHHLLHPWKDDGRWSFPFGSRWIFTDVLLNFTWGVHQPVQFLEICAETIENGELPERSGGNLLYIDPELCEGPKWATNPWCFLVFSIRSCSTIKSVFFGKMCQFLFLTFDFFTINSSSSLWKMAVWPSETEVLVSGFCHPTQWWKFWQWAQSYQVQLTHDMRWYDNGFWGKSGEKKRQLKMESKTQSLGNEDHFIMKCRTFTCERFSWEVMDPGEKSPIKTRRNMILLKYIVQNSCINLLQKDIMIRMSRAKLELKCYLRIMLQAALTWTIFRLFVSTEKYLPL